MAPLKGQSKAYKPIVITNRPFTPKGKVRELMPTTLEQMSYNLVVVLLAFYKKYTQLSKKYEEIVFYLFFSKGKD